MPSKKHVTALGTPFDMAAMRAKNEKVRAVGNMNVNARGDIIDSHNQVINDVTKRVNVMYERTMQAVKSHSLPQSKTSQSTKSVPKNIFHNEIKADELQNFDDDIPNPKK